jgi:autotransporter-associated beta strand protein
MRTRYIVVASLAVASASPAVLAQLSITTNSPHNQDFNTLPNATGTNYAASGGIFGQGWSFDENGSNANLTYVAGTGSDNAGNTYSFGATGVGPLSDRAFGFLQSGSLTSILGFTFTNDTGQPVNRIVVGYTGENWRRITAPDTLAFSYQGGTPALDVMSGWTAVTGLNYTTNLTGSAIALDGNNAANRSVKSPVAINGLSIGKGTAFTLRWVDATASSSAGLAIDDFSISLLTVRGNHWVGSDTTLGGSGTWTDNSGSSWAETDANGIGYFWDSTKKATFAGTTGGTVTVNGTVNAGAGLAFTSAGYAVTGGTINLNGTSLATNTIEVAPAVSVNMKAELAGTNGLRKTGTGTLVVNSPVAYTGKTHIAEGTLTVGSTGSLATSSIIDVDSGAILDVPSGYTIHSGQTLQGNGSVTGGNVTILGTLSPGASAGLLSFPSQSSTLILGDTAPGGAGATVNMEIDGTARGVEGGYDAVDVAGTIAYDGALEIQFNDTFAEGSSFDLFNFTGQALNFDSVTLNGTYSGSLDYNAALGTWSSLISGMTFTFTNSDGVLSLSTEAVPEPLTAAGVMLLSSRVLGRRSRISL